MSVVYIFFAGLSVVGIIAIITAFFGGRFLADRFINLIWSEGDENYKMEPQYSIARARIQEGKFEDAIQEFRNAISLYPDDINVHFYIADVFANHLNQPLDALSELDWGQNRTKDPNQMARFVIRKAEIHLHKRQDAGNAILEIELFLQKYPQCEAAVVLNEKLKQIRKIQEARQQSADGSVGPI